MLEGGLDWKPLSLSPKDMDFIAARNGAAREIALAFGVPPMLLGIPGDNTYSNYQEAQRAFWRSTVLPLVTRTAKALSSWLAPAWETGSGKPSVYPERGQSRLELRPDLDQIEALTSEREALWARIEKVSFLTLNEKRAAVGYAPLEEATPPAPATEGDAPAVVRKYRPDQARAPRGTPEGGEWVDEGRGSGSRLGTSVASGVGAPAGDDEFGDENVRVAQAGSNRGTPRSPILARFPEATPAQEVRWAISNVHAQEAIARAQAAIPGYRPRDSLTSTIEGEIARNEANARDAQRALAEAAARQSAGSRSSSAASNPRSIEEVCTPGGALIGRRSKGAGQDTTTVTRSEFDALLRELTRGAEEVKPRSNYDGLWYRRTDGTTIGVRRSEGSGLTIDIIDSLQNSTLPAGMRIHFND